MPISQYFISEVVTKPSTFGIRHFQCLLLFGAMLVSYAMRVNLSVAIVAMTDDKATDFKGYNWSDKTKSLILSSFFWGYILTQVPSGTLARKFGGKVMLLSSNLVCSILSILIPICIDIGNWQLLCVLRVLQGFSQGCLFPSTHTILSKWSPVGERSTLGTYIYSGTQFGTVIMLSTSGIIASSNISWPGIFYLSGSVGLFWSLIWFIWGANSPNECKTISTEEKKYIETSLCVENQDKEMSQKFIKVPWLNIFMSKPFLALALVHCTHSWGFWTLLTEIPSYLKNILGMDIKKNAILSALPYAAMFFLSFVFSIIQSILYKRRYVSLLLSRKLFNSIGQWIPMLTLIGLGYIKDNQTNLTIVLLISTVGINGASYLGFQVNHIDLSPNFAGVLMGITNCAANVMGIMAPLVVGFIVTDEKNSSQWRVIFFISAGFYFVGNLFFIVFGKTNVQPWNNNDKRIQTQHEYTI